MSVSALTRSVTLICLFFSVNAVIIGRRKSSERTVFQKARTWAFGSLNRVPASAGVMAGMSPLPGGR